MKFMHVLLVHTDTHISETCIVPQIYFRQVWQQTLKIFMHAAHDTNQCKDSKELQYVAK